MKRILLLSYTILIALQVYSYNWTEIGPPGTGAKKIKFAHQYFIVIPSSGPGMYLSNSSIGTWNYYQYGSSSIIDVFQNSNFFGDSLIVLVGDAGYSDGLYSFNPNTGQFNLLFYCYEPRFIESTEEADKFFLGSSHGLFESDDLINWSQVSALEERDCIDFTSSQDYSGYLVLVENEGDYQPLYSLHENKGWQQWSLPEPCSEIEANDYFYYALSESTGVVNMYKSEVFTLDFNVVYSSEHLSVLGNSRHNYLFLGWNQGAEPGTGISRYDEEILNFNEGLPDKNILYINTPPQFGDFDFMSCCTPSGVFELCDYNVGTDNPFFNDRTIYPTLISSCTTNRISMDAGVPHVSIYNCTGRIIMKAVVVKDTGGTHYMDIPAGSLSPGIYIIQTGRKQSKKSFRILVY